jgi:uncharacterized membrane protein YdjX (TVP38/TMEM64 family)
LHPGGCKYLEGVTDRRTPRGGSPEGAGTPAGGIGKRLLGLLIAFAALAVLALGLWLAPLVTREKVEAVARAGGAWGPFVLLGVQAVQIVIAPIPGIFVPILAGFLYGPLLGTAVTAAGTLAGAGLAFTIGRRAGRPLVERWVGREKLAKARRLVSGRRWLALVPLFLFPFSPSDLLCFAAGVTGLATGPFLLAVALGRFPKDVAWCLVGAGLLHFGG